MGNTTNLRETVWFRDLRLLRMNVGVAFFVFFFFSCFNLFLTWTGNVDPTLNLGLLFVLPMIPGYAILAMIRPLRFLKVYHITLFLLSCAAFVVSSMVSDDGWLQLYWTMISLVILVLQIVSRVVLLKPENYFGPETESR